MAVLDSLHGLSTLRRPFEHMTDQLKFVIYTRKSKERTEDQVLSLESQVRELKEFAAKEKLNVVVFPAILPRIIIWTYLKNLLRLLL